MNVFILDEAQRDLVDGYASPSAIEFGERPPACTPSSTVGGIQCPSRRD